MSMLAVLSLFALSKANDVINPKCNFASPQFGYGGHVFPIGVCSKDRTANGIETSFKFICNDEGTVDLEEYDDFDCMGTPTITMDLSSGGNDTDLTSFECGMDACDYSLSCSYGSCGTNTSDPMVTTCSDCVANPDQYEVQCQAFIINECYGAFGAYKYDECADKKLSEYIYLYGTNCSSPTAFKFELSELGGLSPSDYCAAESYTDDVTNHFYHTVECYTMGTTMTPQTTVDDMTNAPTNEPTMNPVMDTQTTMNQQTTIDRGSAYKKSVVTVMAVIGIICLQM